MQALSDASNLPQGQQDKRIRLQQLQQPASLNQIVDRAGIRGLIDSADGQMPAPEVDDPRQAHRQLSADLAVAAIRNSFMASLAEALSAEGVLRRCLLPITVTVQVSFATGDSFLRMLLNMPNVQQPVAMLLLHKLPEYSRAECDDRDGNGSSSNESSIPSLILGQLSWLEVIADPAGLTASLLEVLPVCSPTVQQQLIGLLPEVVQSQDHQAVLNQLQLLLEQDLSFMAAALECIGSLQLGQSLQDKVLSFLLSQLPAVEVADLPGLVKHLISSATKSNAEEVLTTVRNNLHFASPADPRIAVIDRKQKGAAMPNTRSPEVLLVKELINALQTSEVAATACMQLEGNQAEPAQHKCVDLLLLLALHGKQGASRKNVEACLKKKLTSGQATPGWMCRALQGHQASFREVWPSLLSLAELWSRAKEPQLAIAAAQLYTELFAMFEGTLERQQVLQALHGHLGSGVAGEQDVALQVLSELATCHRPLLHQYSAYLANVLDHLDDFSNSQLQQVFGMFAALTAVQPAAASQAAQAGAATSGSRLEDELSIVLSKALAQQCPKYKRIGVIGNLAMLQQAAKDFELLSDADGTTAVKLQDSWVNRAQSVFANCINRPGALAFMLDQWADMLEQQTAAATSQTAAAASAKACTSLPRPLLEWLCDKVQELMNNMFIGDPPVPSQPSEDRQQPDQSEPVLSTATEDSNLQAQLCFNLDGAFSPCCIRILPLAASKDMANRSQLVWMAAGLRLLAALYQLHDGKLTAIDALLGCPLVLPEMAVFTNGRWDCLPTTSKATALASVAYAICWLREVVAQFAPCISTDMLTASEAAGTQAMGDTIAETQNKLMMRLSQLRALEELYRHLVISCPAAAQQVPDLARPWFGAAYGSKVAPAQKAAGAGSNSSKAEATETAAAAAATSRLRCLRVRAAHALSTCQPPDMLLTSLLPATHLAQDVHNKLKLLISKARRPAMLAVPLTAAAGSSGIGSGGCAAAGPPCLQGIHLQQYVEQLVPLLPALQRHLTTALSAIKDPPEGDYSVLLDGLPGASNPSVTALFGTPAAQRVVEAVSSAHALAMACLQTFTLLLSCGKELPGPLIQAVLTSLAPQEQAAPAAHQQQQAQKVLVRTFTACRHHSCLRSGCSNLQLELAVLSLLKGITALAASRGYAPELQSRMGAKISEQADKLLQESWQQQASEEAEEETSTPGFSWKGQSVAIAQLLSLLISYAPDPSDKLLALVKDVLPAVPGKVAAKQQLDPAGGCAALCSATFTTWYKVVFEELCSCWSKLVKEGEAIIAAAAREADGSSSSKGKRRKQQLQTNSQGIPDWDEQQVGQLVGHAGRCCEAFAAIVTLTKQHTARNGVLAAAVKHGTSYVDGMLKAIPLLKVLYESGFHREVVELVPAVQKGTRLLQMICTEGKARGAGSLVSYGPAAKKTLESFVFAMKAFCLEMGDGDSFWMGNLKHRDMAGNCVASQMYPAADHDDDEEEQDEEDTGMDEVKATDGDAEAEGSAAYWTHTTGSQPA